MYLPKIGEKVRMLDNCHPRCIGKVCRVTAVYFEDGQWWWESKHFDPKYGEVFTSGILGAVEPAPNCEVDTF